jgi:hypothetical protein
MVIGNRNWPITVANSRSLFPTTAGAATFAYAALSVLMTWPLARGLARDVPGDFGDPIFTSWVLAWDATHLGRGWWDANIFAPHRLALAYSEHFLPQALQAMPIYWATGNPILCYNLLFLSTFVLSGLGMFLFARELTRSGAAAFVGGLAFAFTPFRIASIPHLQVLSAAWMPFVLYALRRHFDTRRAAPLVAAAAAWIAQNLSCGYYLLFFSPIVLLYIVWEVWRRRLWRASEEVAMLAGACGAVALVTAPLVWPYLELRRLGFNPRSLDETRRFSADVYGYLTADPNLHLWGALLQAWPRPEGLLFPGLTVLVLAAVAVGSSVRSAGDGRGANVAIASVTLFLAIVCTLLLGYSIRLPALKITSLWRVVILGTGTATIWLAVSRAARSRVGEWLRKPPAFLTIVVLFSVAMSFGPDIHARGRTIAGSNIYALAYNYVPGFDGLRVPARYAMVASLALAGLGAIGLTVLSSARMQSAAVPLIASGLVLVEAFAVPIPINQNTTEYRDKSLAPLPPAISLGATAPPVYQFVARLPSTSVLLELPLGEPAFDIRYMLYSTLHWRKLVNGYSGGAPIEYQFLTEALKDVDTRADRAWRAVVDSTATHLLLHEAFYKEDRGARIATWLRANGAHEVASFGSDRVFALSR